MICLTCAKLSFLFTKKKCVRCTGEAVTNLSILCENCSNKDKICAVCLKKVEKNYNNKNKFGKCACGG